jgi:Tfp pilus assembly protein PilX
MSIKTPVVNNENGSVILVAIMILAVLMILAISSSNTSTTEVQIATSGQRHQLDFYVADSGWKDAGMWLENQPGPPALANTAGPPIVKNFGAGTASDADTSDLSVLTPDENAFGQYSIPYWYEIEHNPALTEVVPGSGNNFRRYFYNVTSNANQTQVIDVWISKIYSMGYN